MRRVVMFVAALVAAAFTGVAPAEAGTGQSTYCFDGIWTDLPLLPGPVTVGVEVNTGSPGTWIAVCYATSEVGYTGGHVTGGLIQVFVAPNGSGHVRCAPDSNPYVIWDTCLASFSFSPTTGGLSVTATGTADSNLTAPVTVGTTGVAVSPFVFVSPGVSVIPRYPCIWVLGTQVVPNCGAVIV